MDQDAKDYVLNADKPGLGRAGDVVQLSAQQAKYLILSGAVEIPAPPKKSAGKSGKQAKK